jgi:pyruvate,water dikinase
VTSGRVLSPEPLSRAAADPLLVGLLDERACDPVLVGAKAANLARLAQLGAPVLPGIVVTTAATALWPPSGEVPADVVQPVLEAAGRLTARHAGPLVVRSSSTVEDAARSSMAGRFRSILGVDGSVELIDALRTVRASAADVGGSDPIAVLVQPQLPARLGGVLFGVDPVGGDRRRLVVEVAAGNPGDLVGGRVNATHLVMSRRGRPVSRSGEGPTLGRRDRRALASMATRVERVFGGAQDVEWAEDLDGRIWFLQCRPVTAVDDPATGGPVLGPGPVAETFPDILGRLEIDLWLEPLREGIVRALTVTGAVSRRRLAASPVALAVRGRAAVDLELLGVRRRRASRLLPAVGMRRLAAAWRVGRLRAALGDLAAHLVARVDDQLADVPPLAGLTDAELLTLLANTRDALVSVHGYEVLAGMLLPHAPTGPPAAAVALATLARARATGTPDAVTVVSEPAVLALTAPRIGGVTELPPAPPAAPAPGGGPLGARESLRLRSRWLQELSGRAAARLAEVLAADGRLPEPSLVRDLSLAELRAVVDGEPPPVDLAERAAEVAGPPLPPEFRLTAGGAAVAIRHGGADADGLGAGGGRAMGHVRQSPDQVDPDATVLVVATLDPALATTLPSLAGLVSETGSALSHLAILARELGVATVVGVPDARRRFPSGTRVLVDGLSGRVERLDDNEVAA